MAYTTILDLPEKQYEDMSGAEFVLATTTENSYKISLNSINDYLIQTSAGTYQELTNKVIDNITNYVHANAIHYVAKAVQDISKGTPVKLVQSTEEFVIVDICSSETDITIGICEDGILEGELGEIIVSGILDGYDTSPWTEGTMLYAYNGVLTSTQPTTGNIQFIGYVLNSSSNGKILVNGSDPYPDARSVLFDKSFMTGEMTATNVQDAITQIVMYIHQITTNRLLIKLDTDTNQPYVDLPYTAKDKIYSCDVYATNLETDNVCDEYTCGETLSKDKVYFSSSDLDIVGKYAVIQYIAWQKQFVAQ